MGDAAIVIENVSAVYGRGKQQIHSLHQINLTVQSGEVCGVLGPNGAGKTTLLDCIEGLHQPTSGRIRVAGHDISQCPSAVKRSLGVQLQRTALLNDLTVSELIDVYAALYKVYLTRSQIDKLLERFELAPQRHVFARRLSSGQQQRLALAIAVAHEPEIILLDEPTTALDPHARRALWAMIRLLQREGRTVLLTTHAMEEAETLCDQVAIFDRGRVVACDTVVTLIGELQAAAVVKATTTLSAPEAYQLSGVDEVREHGQALEMITHQPFVTIAALHEMTTCRGHTVRDLVLRQPNLEDVFSGTDRSCLAGIISPYHIGKGNVMQRPVSIDQSDDSAVRSQSTCPLLEYRFPRLSPHDFQCDLWRQGESRPILYNLAGPGYGGTQPDGVWAYSQFEQHAGNASKVVSLRRLQATPTSTHGTRQ